MLENPSYLAGSPGFGGFVKPTRPEEGRLPDVRVTPTDQVRRRHEFSWPWGLVAIGVMALAWVGIYLLWNGIVFLFYR